ncbi:hypothetical protein [Rhizobium sp. GCM10022189]|uniref:hypothetical protein n=1 Tax=Rhizobium sp. GCM10022189 TaxID=3252654 RepID=UPI00360CA5C5
MNSLTGSEVERAERSELYAQRQLASFARADASAAEVAKAFYVTRNAKLPRAAIEFRFDEEIAGDGYWPLVGGFGAAFESYISSLRNLEAVRRSTSVVKGLTDNHLEAFETVRSSAAALDRLGWPVNWEQNVQKILETTDLGVRKGKLVSRLDDLPEYTTLSEEMLLLGSLTFYHQDRVQGEEPRPFRPKSLTSHSRQFEGITMHLCQRSDRVPDRFRYCSEWLEGKGGRTFRIAI